MRKIATTMRLVRLIGRRDFYFVFPGGQTLRLDAGRATQFPATLVGAFCNFTVCKGVVQMAVGQMMKGIGSPFAHQGYCKFCHLVIKRLWALKRNGLHWKCLAKCHPSLLLLRNKMDHIVQIVEVAGKKSFLEVVEVSKLLQVAGLWAVNETSFVHVSVFGKPRGRHGSAVEPPIAALSVDKRGKIVKRF